MGKAKKIKVSKGEKCQPKLGLGDQIEEGKTAKMKNRKKVRIRTDGDEEYVDAALSQRILSQARRQQMEMEEELSSDKSCKKTKKPITKLGESLSDSDNEFSDNEIVRNVYYEDIQINQEDEKAIEMFMDRNRAPAKTLADMIMEKLEEKKTEIDTQFSDAGTIQVKDLDPREIAILEQIRDILPKYRKLKIPQPVRDIMTRPNWEQILSMLDPTSWSATAMFAVTRVFSSNLTERKAQRFYNLVLLPRIRDDLAEYKRLNPHLYAAIQKALYKPGAFMKGIILPLLESGTCTLREAVIIGSIVAKLSIPILHSSAALLKIAEMDYTGANSIFLRIFIDKKYALPYRVVDGVVFHFLRFRNDQRELPVLWHQALLSFAQRYKNDISYEQKEALLELLKHQYHQTITPEVRRELQHAKCRDSDLSEPKSEPMAE